MPVWEQLLHLHKGDKDWRCLGLVLYGNQLFCWSWLCSTCPTPRPARSSSPLHYVVFHLVFIAHNNLLILWPFLNPNFPDPKSNFLQIISLEKSERIPIKNADRSHCQLLKTQQSLLQRADSGNKLRFVENLSKFCQPIKGKNQTHTQNKSFLLYCSLSDTQSLSFHISIA